MERGLEEGINKLVIHLYNDNGIDYGIFNAPSMLKDNTVGNDIIVPSNILVKLDELDEIKLRNNDNDNNIDLKTYQKLLRLNTNNYKELKAFQLDNEYKNNPDTKEITKLKDRLEELYIKKDSNDNKQITEDDIKNIEDELKKKEEKINNKIKEKKTNIEQNLKKNITLILNSIFKDNRNITLPNNAGDNEIVRSKYSFGLVTSELTSKNKNLYDKEIKKYNNQYDEYGRYGRYDQYGRYDKYGRSIRDGNSDTIYKQRKLENENKFNDKNIYWGNTRSESGFIKYEKKDKETKEVKVDEKVLEKGGKTIHIIVVLKLKKGRTEVLNKFLGPLAKCKIKRQSLKEQLKYHLESFEEYIKPKTKKRLKQKGGYKTRKRIYY